MTVIGVIGVGAMGLPMATNLAEDFEVRVCDVSAERLALAREAGLEVKDSAAACAAGANVVLVAVRNASQLNELMFGEDEIATSLAEGSAVILTSTVGIEAVMDVAARLATQGVHLVDAPVSGGPARAGEGDLLVVVGATPEAYALAQPVLEKMASNLVLVGDAPGKGQAMKTVNQLLCGVHIAAAGEALALARALGLDVAQALEALMSGAAASFMLGDRGQRMLQAYDDKPAEVKSRLDIFTKDMDIVTTAAKRVGLSTPVAAAAEQLYLQAVTTGDAAADDSTVIKGVAPRASRD